MRKVAVEEDVQRREEFEERLRELQRQRRNRHARRRRFFQKHPDIGRKYRDMRSAHEDMMQHYESAAHAYDARCRHVWRNDPEVRSHIAAATRARRRELRLEHQIDEKLTALGVDQTTF